ALKFVPFALLSLISFSKPKILPGGCDGEAVAESYGGRIVMGLVKPWKFLATLAWLALLVYVIYVYGTYQQASLDSGVPAMVQRGSPLIKAISNHNEGDINKLISSPNNNHNEEDVEEPISSPVTVKLAPKGSLERKRAQQELDDEIARRNHTDCIIKEIGKAVFGEENYSEMIMTINNPIVHDWHCYKAMILAYIKHCGALSEYGLKYIQAFANMCNAGFQHHQLAEVASQVCNRTCTLGSLSLRPTY
ncbi:Vacuolar-processing enzyme gamma-isozyme, partial [Bienertia sinuspersici]